jgi:entericidin B
MTRIVAILAAIVAVFAIAGCNTMQGVGKDVKKGGESIEKAAK